MRDILLKIMAFCDTDHHENDVWLALKASITLSFIHTNAGASRSVTPKTANPMISNAMHKILTHSIVVPAGCSDLILPDELTFIPTTGNRRNNCYRASAN